MAESWEKAFLELLEKPIGQLAESVSVTEQEDGQPVLQAVFPIDDADEDLFLPLQISIEHINGNTNQVQVYTVLFDEIPDDLISVCETLVCRINEMLILGHFGLLYDAGQIYFQHAQVVDTDSDAGVIVNNLGTALDITLTTVGKVYGFLFDTVKRKISPKEAIAVDIGLIQ